MRVMTKSENEVSVKDWSLDALLGWYKEHTDDEGNVRDELYLFNYFPLKVSDENDLELLFTDDAKSIPWVLSTYSVDRDYERIDPAGWELKTYKRNPVVLWSHDYLRPAIGKLESPRVKDGRLVGKVNFASEIDPFAMEIEQKVKGGFVSTGSVGFRSMKIEIVDDKDKPERLIHRKQELFEFSICNVPANVEAAAERSVGFGDTLGQATGEMQRDDMTDQGNRLEQHIEQIETEMRILAEAISELREEKQSYIKSILKDFYRENSGGRDRETSDFVKDLKNGRKSIEEVLHG